MELFLLILHDVESEAPTRAGSDTQGGSKTQVQKIVSHKVQ